MGTVYQLSVISESTIWYLTRPLYASIMPSHYNVCTIYRWGKYHVVGQLLVRGEAFYDRDWLLDSLSRELQGFLHQSTRSHLALVGPRKAGKTSLLFELQRRFEGEEVFMLYLYLKPELSRLFVHRFLISLLADFLRGQDYPVDQVILPTHSSLEALMQQAIPLLPSTRAQGHGNHPPNGRRRADILPLPPVRHLSTGDWVAPGSHAG